MSVFSDGPSIPEITITSPQEGSRVASSVAGANGEVSSTGVYSRDSARGEIIIQ